MEALQKLRPPSSKKDVKRFLGAVQYISQFISGYQEIVNPLTYLLRKSVEFHWDTPQEQAWLKIKDILTKPPILGFTSHSPSDFYNLTTDTSKLATGSALYQAQTYFNPESLQTRSMFCLVIPVNLWLHSPLLPTQLLNLSCLGFTLTWSHLNTFCIIHTVSF